MSEPPRARGRSALTRQAEFAGAMRTRLQRRSPRISSVFRGGLLGLFARSLVAGAGISIVLAALLPVLIGPSDLGFRMWMRGEADDALYECWTTGIGLTAVRRVAMSDEEARAAGLQWTPPLDAEAWCWPGGQDPNGPITIYSGLPFKALWGGVTLSPGENPPWTVLGTHGAVLASTNPAATMPLDAARVVPYAPLWGGLIANSICCALPVAALGFVVGWMRLSRRRKAGKCVRCGFPLDQSPELSCPECGLPVR